MLFWQGNMDTFVAIEFCCGPSVIMFIGTKRKSKREVIRCNAARLIRP